MRGHAGNAALLPAAASPGEDAADKAASQIFSRPCLSVETPQVRMFVSRLQRFADFYLSRQQRDGLQAQELLSSDGEAENFRFSSEIVLTFRFSLVLKRPRRQKPGGRRHGRPPRARSGVSVPPGRLQEGEISNEFERSNCIGVWFAPPPSVGGVCSSGFFPQVWVMALCVTCVFAITLSVFPVITVRVRTVYQDDVTWGQCNS